MMKKTFFVLFFHFISLVCACQIKTSGIFETGYENKRTIIYLPSELDYLGIFPYNDLKCFYGLLYLDAEYKGIKIYTSDKTYFNKDYEIYFNPQLSEFKIGLSYTYKNFMFGYEHMCSHYFEIRKFSESYDRVYLRIKLF
jgi:hypothetical protein